MMKIYVLRNFFLFASFWFQLKGFKRFKSFLMNGFFILKSLITHYKLVCEDFLAEK